LCANKIFDKRLERNEKTDAYPNTQSLHRGHMVENPIMEITPPCPQTISKAFEENPRFPEEFLQLFYQFFHEKCPPIF
jgi:hypothetical protein